MIKVNVVVFRLRTADDQGRPGQWRRSHLRQRSCDGVGRPGRYYTKILLLESSLGPQKFLLDQGAALLHLKERQQGIILRKRIKVGRRRLIGP